MIAIGIDPDTKTTGVGIVELLPDGTLKPLHASLVRAKGRRAADRRIEMADALQGHMDRLNHVLALGPGETVIGAVEWMKLRPKGEKNPNAIVDLNGIAGMCVSSLLQLCPEQIFTPIPSDWKGSAPKNVFTKRIVGRLGLTMELTYDNGIVLHGAEKMPKSMRTHAIDGLGLAAWALKEWAYAEKLKARA